MAKEATAKVTFTLENAEEVLNLLRQLKGFIDGQGPGGTPGVGGAPPAPGTPTGSGTAAPPAGQAPLNPATANPGANPGAIPANSPVIATAATAGSPFGYFNPQSGGFSGLMYDPTVGRFFDPANGSYMLGGAGFGFGGAGGPGRPAVPPTPAGGFGAFASAMAGAGAASMASQILNTTASQMGSAQAAGQPFYYERLGPAAMALGGLALGAAIGAPFGGVGAIPGAVIGGTIGFIAGSTGGSFLQPLIERGIAEDQLRRLITATGYANMSGDSLQGGLPQDMLDSMVKGIGSGQALAPGTYQTINRMYPETPAARQILVNALTRSGYGARNLRRYGDPEAREYSPDEMMDVLIGASYGNEFETSRALMELENVGPRAYKAAREMRQRGVQRIILEDEARALGPENSLAGFMFGRAGRYGGSAGARGAAGGYRASTMAEVGNMRRRASLMRQGGDEMGARAMEAQATQMEVGMDDTIADSIFGLQMEEAGARAGLETGRADRAFQTALYGGQSAASLPWERRSRAYENQASELERLMAERGDRLSPAERMRMTEQIENLRFQARTGVAREREQAINSENIARTGLEGAQAMSREMPGILRGSAIEQTREYDLQRENLERQQRTLEQILQTSRYLTAEQRIQLQTQVEGLKVEQDRLKIAGGIARAGARYSTSETATIEGSVGPTLALIRGAGGAAATDASLALLGATESNLAAKQSQLAELKAMGLDEDHPEVQKVRREIAGMTIQRETQQRGMAVVSMSAEDRARRSNLSTQAAFYQQGYGSFGDVRGNLMAQIGMNERRMDELAANRDRLRKEGKWTPAMEADYTEARNAAAMEALQLEEQYTFGWDQRLISQAYNMPAQGRLFMSGFTRKEAAAYGVFHRAFGGSEEQTRQMREMYPRMMRHLGSGNPMNFADRAMASEMKGQLDIRITVDDPSGRIRDTGVQVVNQKTSQDFNLNVSAAKRQSG